MPAVSAVKAAHPQDLFRSGGGAATRPFRTAGPLSRGARERFRPPGKERFAGRLRRQRRAGPDGDAAIAGKLAGAVMASPMTEAASPAGETAS